VDEIDLGTEVNLIASVMDLGDLVDHLLTEGLTLSLSWGIGGGSGSGFLAGLGHTEKIRSG
jgi:hypothetical protein